MQQAEEKFPRLCGLTSLTRLEVTGTTSILRNNVPCLKTVPQDIGRLKRLRVLKVWAQPTSGPCNLAFAFVEGAALDCGAPFSIQLPLGLSPPLRLCPPIVPAAVPVQFLGLVVVSIHVQSPGQCMPPVLLRSWTCKPSAKGCQQRRLH